MGERECGMLVGMRPPSFVRTLTEEERQALEQGLRSPEAFVVRRCQILLARARGERAPRIAQDLGLDDQTVLDALQACNAQGRAGLQQGPRAPHAPAWSSARSRPSGCGRSCIAALASLANRPASGRWPGRPR